MCSFLLIIILISAPMMRADSAGSPDGQGVPTVVDINRYDLEKLTDEFKTSALSDNLAHRLIDFDYMAKAGTQGVMFQSSYGTTGRDETGAPDRGEDDAFRLWAARAERSHLLVGAYHFYHPAPTETPAETARQVAHFLDHVREICRDNPRDFSGQPILLAFDLRNDNRSGLELLKSAALFARLIHAQTGVWPGIYPENGDRKGLNNPKYYAAVGQLSPEDRLDLQRCWLWASRYNSVGPDVALYSSNDTTPRQYYGLWPEWTLWQYYAAENWYTDSDSAALHYNSTTHFPIAAAGALMPVDCNYFHGDPKELPVWWSTHGWIALPAASQKL